MPHASTRTVLEPIQQATFKIEGELGRRLDAVTEQWILPAPFANPGMLEMFRNRDRKPYQQQVPWAGEFAGKFLTHAVQIYRLTRDPRLGKHIDWFVGELTALQSANGYLGPWPTPYEMRQGGPTCREPWDAWGHYHAMLGLLLWHADQRDERAMRCAKRIGDYFCDRFLHGEEKLHGTGALEMNQAPVHSLTMLYEVTGEKKYLAMAKKIVKEFELPPAGDYLRAGLAGKPFHETPKPRWESLHPIMGLSELYFATGDKDARKAFESLWWSMLRGDRHNNGGFTSGEQATGNPYHDGAIETCCTIAWMAMSVEMLRMTGDSLVADEIEISLLNSGVGMMSPSGRWVTYNTPMHGQREASAHTIVFQARAGTPELNCCSVNGPRALGMICEWAVMAREGGLALNYYGPCRLTAPLASGNRVVITQNTDYPRDGRVDIRVAPDKPEKFTLALRVPYWSERTTVTVNGKAVKRVKPGRYLELAREWRAGDRVSIELDFRPHFWSWREVMDVSDWETDWTLYGPLPRLITNTGDSPPWPSVNSVASAINATTGRPATLEHEGKTYAARLHTSADGVIDGQPENGPNGKHSILAGVTEVKVDRETNVTIHFSADWWCAWYVNGQRAFDNTYDPLGNRGDFTSRRNAVNVRLVKGVNRIVFINGGGGQRGNWISLAASDNIARPKRSKPALKGRYEASVYRGPLLLAFDPRHNDKDQHTDYTLDASKLAFRSATAGNWLEPWMLLETRDADGKRVRLCDFGSAGGAGNIYATWLRVKIPGRVTSDFTRENPLRSFRV